MNAFLCLITYKTNHALCYPRHCVYHTEWIMTGKLGVELYLEKDGSFSHSLLVLALRAQKLVEISGR